MRDVRFRVDEAASLEIRSLDGALLRTQKGASPFFDEPATFELALSDAEIAIDEGSLSAILNRYAFSEPDSPIRDIEITAEGSRLRQRGTLRKGAVETRFDILGEISPTPDGKLRLRPVSIKVGGLKVTRLLDALGVSLADVVKLDGSRGVSAEGDDLLLSPHELLPPPRISGRVAAARVEGRGVVITFGAGRGGDSERGYMRFRGGTLRFGKLTMARADLEIADADPRDPLDFYLAEYQKQLSAGYALIRKSRGLRVLMPDYEDLKAGAAPLHP
jgi:hypothetical protein